MSVANEDVKTDGCWKSILNHKSKPWFQLYIEGLTIESIVYIVEWERLCRNFPHWIWEKYLIMDLPNVNKCRIICLVISPLKSLMYDQCREATAYAIPAVKVRYGAKGN